MTIWFWRMFEASSSDNDLSARNTERMRVCKELTTAFSEHTEKPLYRENTNSSFTSTSQPLSLSESQIHRFWHSGSLYTLHSTAMTMAPGSDDCCSTLPQHLRLYSIHTRIFIIQRIILSINIFWCIFFSVSIYLILNIGTVNEFLNICTILATHFHLAIRILFI